MLGSQLLLAVIGILAVIAMALSIGPLFVWLRIMLFGRGESAARPVDPDPAIELRPIPLGATNGVKDHAGADEEGTGIPLVSRAAEHERTIRIVSWAFLMAVAIFAAASGVWVATLPAIVILVALTGEAFVVLQDIIPATPLRAARGPLQALVAIAFAGALVALTGGLTSPFTFTFPLIVGAGALLASPRAAVLLTVVASAAYLAAGLIGSPEPATAPLVQLFVNTTGIFLLAYIGASVGREQRRARDAAIRLSTVDSLTGLFNRSYFFTAIERELARSDRSGRAFCLVMLDVDDLKTVNDRAGHHAGDQVLRSVADVVKTRIRKIDIAARYGGDEFAILLPETDPTGGWVFAEKVRQTVAEQGMPGPEPGSTISIGVVSYPADGRTADALVGSADRAMYQSKRNGKNRVARVSGGAASETGQGEPARSQEGARPG